MLFKGITIALVIVCIIAGGVFLYLYYGVPMPAHPSFVSKIQVKDDHLFMTGMTADSAYVFCGYDYKAEGESAYISLRYSLPSSFHKSGSYRIDADLDMKAIRKIYLKSWKKSDAILIWEKK